MGVIGRFSSATGQAFPSSLPSVITERRSYEIRAIIYIVILITSFTGYGEIKKQNSPLCLNSKREKASAKQQYPADGFFYTDIRQEGWYLVFEYVYYWPAEMLPDPLDAEVTIRKLLFEEINHLYHTSDPKMKNSVKGLINEGIIFRYFYRNEDLEWGLHVDFSLRDVIPQRS